MNSPRVMTGAIGVAQGVGRRADSFVKSQIERILRDSDFVTREEFEAVREMAILARDENEKLMARSKRWKRNSPRRPESLCRLWKSTEAVDHPSGRLWCGSESESVTLDSHRG